MHYTVHSTHAINTIYTAELSGAGSRSEFYMKFKKLSVYII